MFVDDFIKVTHSITCADCTSYNRVITSMNEWLNHKKKYPNHKRKSHLVVIKGFKEDLMLKIKL